MPHFYLLGSTHHALSPFQIDRRYVRTFLAGHPQQVRASRLQNATYWLQNSFHGQKFKKKKLIKDSNQKAAVNHQQENCNVSTADMGPRKKASYINYYHFFHKKQTVDSAPKKCPKKVCFCAMSSHKVKHPKYKCTVVIARQNPKLKLTSKIILKYSKQHPRSQLTQG